LVAVVDGDHLAEHQVRVTAKVLLVVVDRTDQDPLGRDLTEHPRRVTLTRCGRLILVQPCVQERDRVTR